MPAILVSLLGSVLPYLVIAAGVLALYLGIKRKGALAERAKWEQAQAEVLVKTQAKVTEAVGKDAEIDARTASKIKEIETGGAGSTSSTDPSKFRF